MSTPSAAGGFEIGQIQRKGDVARTLVRLARAIAKGEVDPKTGRLVADALRAASAAASDGTELAEADGAPLGARELQDHELEFVIQHGHLPPDVVEVGSPKWWVAGPVWHPPRAVAAEAEPER